MESMMEKKIQELAEKYEFRTIRQDEGEQTVEIENVCFPPNEACSRTMMLERIAKAPDYFLVAIDRQTGKIAGFLNGLATDEEVFRDEFFTDASLHNPKGRNIMLLGLNVMPQYRMQGLGRELMRRYLDREQARGRKKVFLTCLDEKVEMYKRMGYHDDGISNSVWGGEKWHDMSYVTNQ